MQSLKTTGGTSSTVRKVGKISEFFINANILSCNDKLLMTSFLAPVNDVFQQRVSSNIIFFFTVSEFPDLRVIVVSNNFTKMFHV